MSFACKCPRESRDKWIPVGIPVVERTWDNTCHQDLLNRRGFQAAYNRVAIPELLERLKQENSLAPKLQRSCHPAALEKAK
ncbi:hypothetical protein AU210_014955 [Fusarium oxysporum f. sp. radicis-cucumerinum]|uniref:Uncharacterized protein n=2 Tax=Fusarium oxysporum TaxID=5507 RepID=A0A2H3G8P7_FUSOX|nr:hypothetical protein AU210_014955 [Fusarium oxysporum f. sp. radicis-cucumerinum]RKL10699.1 hypothetical protein BFJ68_g8677 [Fusarium oxysporum]